MRSSRSRRLFWTAVGGVAACALAVGWYVFTLVAQPLPAQPLQASVSPDGCWQVRTWCVGREQLGHSGGFLRVDVAGLADRRASRPRTIWVERVEGGDAGRRFLMWRDATHLVFPSAGEGEVVLDVVHAPAQSLPGGFVRTLRASAIATAALLGVAVGGVLGVLIVDSWLIRREQARWEAWPVAGAEGRRRAPQG